MRASARRAGTTALRLGLTLLVVAWSGRALALDPSLDVTQYAHTAWRTRDGFTRGRIFGVTQTTDGYLWLATEFGLLRFDGVRAEPWALPGQPLPSSNLTMVRATPDGTLWIGTDNGLAALRDGKLTSYPELGGRKILKLRPGPDGKLWFAAVDLSGGKLAALCSIDSDQARCEESPELGPRIFALYPDRRGDLWVASTTGLWRWRPGPAERYAYPAPVTEANDIIEDDDGAMLLATNDGLKRLVGGRIEPHAFPGFDGVTRPTRFVRTSDGSLWVCTFNGLLHVHRGRTDVFGIEDGLTHLHVMSVFEDREGSVWVNTAAGLHRFRDYRFPSFSARQGLSAYTRAVQATSDGTVWISAADALYRWRDGRIARFDHPTAPASVVGSLAVDDRDRLWAASSDGVFYLEGGRMVRAAGLPGGEAIAAIAPDGRGSAWISVERVGLIRATGGERVEELPWSHFGKAAGAAALLRDRSGDGLWLGFIDGGVSHLVNGRVVASHDAAGGLGGGGVSHLRHDAQGAVWAATAGGVSRIDADGRVLTLGARNGLPCDGASWSMEDGDGSLWVYQPCGLARIARDELDAWVKRPDATVAATIFDAADGVRTVGFAGFYGPPVARAADGRIWFTPFDGVTVIDPRHLPRNALPPPVHIGRVTADEQVFDEAALAGGRLRLPARVRDLAIDYTALSLAAPERVRFRVKLEGQDLQFRELVNERHVRYTNLAPGTYRFVVLAANDSGVWNERGAELALTIPRAFYQASWFRGLGIAAAAALLYAAYRVRVGVLERRQRLLIDAQEEERARIAGELHDGVLQQISAVTLDLGALKYQVPAGSAAKDELAAAQGKLVDIGKELRNLSHELHSAPLLERGLASALCSYCAEFSRARGIAVSCAADPDASRLAPRAALALYRIAQEALANVARHAGVKQAEVRLERADGAVRLTVSDHGAGFVVDRSGDGGGVGLVNMRARLRALDGELEIDSEPGHGTTIRAAVPSRGAA